VVSIILEFLNLNIQNLACTYINERLNRIKHLRWKFGGHLPENIKENLSEQELKWLNTYNQITFNFQNQFGEEGGNGVP
jgi:hypothetical protein